LAPPMRHQQPARLEVIIQQHPALQLRQRNGIQRKRNLPAMQQGRRIGATERTNRNFRGSHATVDTRPAPGEATKKESRQDENLCPSLSREQRPCLPAPPGFTAPGSSPAAPRPALPVSTVPPPSGASTSPRPTAYHPPPGDP